ncbi:hypothetical protein HBI25_020880 [Parastagonospora nodorum]|nr:hypothetical protein HBI25_020880 [Parastagonospora nodorum]
MTRIYILLHERAIYFPSGDRFEEAWQISHEPTNAFHAGFRSRAYLKSSLSGLIIMHTSHLLRISTSIISTSVIVAEYTSHMLKTSGFWPVSTSNSAIDAILAPL